MTPIISRIIDIGSPSPLDPPEFSTKHINNSVVSGTKEIKKNLATRN